MFNFVSVLQTAPLHYSQVLSWVIPASMRSWSTPPWIRKQVNSELVRPSWGRDTTLYVWVRWPTSPRPTSPWVTWPGHCVMESSRTSPPWCLPSIFSGLVSQGLWAVGAPSPETKCSGRKWRGLFPSRWCMDRTLTPPSEWPWSSVTDAEWDL